ncbi:hypothetical protein R3P38DRAFT_3239307 [Favolaschia claudopus]|uniref:Uncharacterized protein n=1 Tax=Favolaschia claudopus TaxID=2862362 RepID=A0AAV9Z8N0_9AGAR
MPPLAHDAVLPPHPRRAQREEDNRPRLEVTGTPLLVPRPDETDTTDDSAPYEYRRELNPDVRGRGIRGSTYAPRSRHDGGRGRNDNFRGRGPAAEPLRRALRRLVLATRPQQARAHQRDEYDHFLGDDDGAKLYSPRRHPPSIAMTAGYRRLWKGASSLTHLLPETTPRGYPILPPVPAEPGDDSEYPSEESDSDDKRQEKKKAAMIKERNRQAAAVAQLAPSDPSFPRPYPTPAPPSAGMFGRLSFDQIDDARSVTKLVGCRGCERLLHGGAPHHVLRREYPPHPDLLG